MKRVTSLVKRCLERTSAPGNLQAQPRRWRVTGAALWLGALALCATTANAQIQWLDADVGNPTFKGSSVNNGGQYTIQGGGSDIWNTSSQFHYLYGWASGTNWDISAQFVSFVGPDAWSKVEFLVDLADTTVGPQGGDPFISMMDTQPTSYVPPYTADGTAGVNNGGVDQFRTTANGNSDWLQVGTTPAPGYPNDWFRIQRQGNIFNLFKSTNGTDWVQYISVDTSKSNLIGQDNQTHFGTAWPDLVAVGVAVTAHLDTWVDPVTGLPAGATAVVANLTATFPPAVPPTLLAVSQQVQSGATNVLGGEASLSFAATNNAFPISAAYPVAYQWMKNGSPVANATNKLFTWLLDTSDNAAQYHCHASLAPPYSSITLDSATATIGVLPGVYKTNGWRFEMFAGVTARTPVEVGNVARASSQKVETTGDDPGGYGNNYVSRSSGWFIAPTSDNYSFFLACDDDSDLFLSTDNTIAHKRLIAQDTAWIGMDSWLATDINGVVGTGGGSFTQSRSDQWSPDAGATIPYQGGIPLSAGQPYYIEIVHNQGGGGDNICVTYQTATMMADPNWQSNFTNGTHSIISGTNGTMMYATIPATFLTWVAQPTNANTTVGFAAKFYSQASSDSEFTPLYQWYKGTPGTGVPVAGATGANYNTPNTTAANQGDTYYVVATTAENEFSITSAVASVTVGLPVLEYGRAVDEYWYTANPDVPAFVRRVTNADLTITEYLQDYSSGPDHTIYQPRLEGSSRSNEAGDNYGERVSGLFYPPATDSYVFFVCSDDNSALFISTDSSPTNAVMVAQETAWSNPWQWVSSGGGSTLSQKRSDQWSDLNGGTPWSAGIHMNKGQAYYVAIVHHEGGGGDNCEATFCTSADVINNNLPADGSYSKFTGNLISSYAPRAFSMTFSQNPATATVPLGGLASFTATGATDSKAAIGDNNDPRNEWNNYIVYQWTKNGVPIPGANSSTYSFGPVSPLDSTLTFACTARALGYTDGSGNPLWATSTVANVVITGNAVYEPGFSLHEFWSLNPGVGAVENNTAGDPSWLMASPAFEVDTQGSDFGGGLDNFTDELVGYFIPATSGNYVFFCNSDDNADLFVSTDSSASGRRMVARETGWAGSLAWGTSGGTVSQVRSDTFVDPATGITLYSNGIPLVAGQKYFMQIVHHQGGGGTESCVTAKLFNDPDPASGTLSTIRGSQVGTYVPKSTFVTVTNQPQSVTNDNYTAATFRAGGATDSIVPVGTETGDWRPFLNNFLFFQWYKNGTAVAGATTSAYTIPDVLPSDNGAQVSCIMRALGYADAAGNALWTTSSVAVLTVITGAPPQLLFSSIYTNANDPGVPLTYVTLNFSEPMDPVALNNMANYVLGGGLIIQSITVNSNTYKNVVLTVTGTPTFPFNVTVNNTRALGGGPALGGSTSTTVNRMPLIDADIGNLIPVRADPAIPGGFYPSGTNAFTIECEGNDIWGTGDGFNFAYEMKTGDFDVVVRQKSTTHTSNWAKGGLMVRETLDANSRDWNIVNDPASADGIQAPDNSGFGANAVECNARVDTSGASAAWSGGVAGTVPAYPNAWVRLTRVGQILTAYWSTNNAATWNLAATNSPAAASTLGLGDLPAAVYVGVCATAHNNDAVDTPADQLRFMAYMDFDSYNSKYVYVAPTTVTLGKPVVANGNVTITWTPANGTLYASPAVAGPSVDWVAVGTGGSVTLPMTTTPRFFKVAP